MACEAAGIVRLGDLVLKPRKLSEKRTIPLYYRQTRSIENLLIFFNGRITVKMPRAP